MSLSAVTHTLTHTHTHMKTHTPCRKPHLLCAWGDPGSGHEGHLLVWGDFNFENVHLYHKKRLCSLDARTSGLPGLPWLRAWFGVFRAPLTPNPRRMRQRTTHHTCERGWNHSDTWNCLCEHNNSLPMLCEVPFGQAPGVSEVQAAWARCPCHTLSPSPHGFVPIPMVLSPSPIDFVPLRTLSPLPGLCPSPLQTLSPLCMVSIQGRAPRAW